VERILNDATPCGALRVADTAVSIGLDDNGFLADLQATPPSVRPPGLSLPATVPTETSPRDHVAAKRLPIVPGYEVLAEIGRGGMGIVYQARDLNLIRLVALKLLLAGNQVEPRFRARLTLEAEAAARLLHPNIVQVHEIGECDHGPYLALEFVSGGSLARGLNGSPQPAHDAARLVATLARAIHYAHEHGVIHRDLKPANILLQGNRKSGIGNRDEDHESRHCRMAGSSLLATPYSLFPKIADFGLARWLDQDNGQTPSGAIMGTPSYMAPEQAGGQRGRIGPAVDVYSLGAILYELLTGRPPFRGETTIDTMLQVLHEEPVPPGRLRPRLPRDLETICLKCLRKEPAKRYASALALADDLELFLAGQPIHARPVGFVERGWRWCRRNPGVAILGAAFALAVALGFAGITLKWLDADEHRREAANSEHAKDVALGKERDERLRKEAALDEAKLHVYFHSIALAHREWLANNVLHAEAILDACPPELRNWEWRYLKRLCHNEALCLHGDDKVIRSVAYSPDGSRVASVYATGSVIVWDAHDGRRLCEYKTPASFSTFLQFSGDGRRLIRIGQPGTPMLHVWDTQSRQTVLDLRDLRIGPVIALSRDSDRLATPAGGGIVAIWDTRTGKQVTSLALRRAYNASLALSADGRRLAGIDLDGRLTLWDAATGAVIQSFGAGFETGASFDLSPMGTGIAAAKDQAICLYELPTGRLIRDVPLAMSGIRRLQFSADGERISVLSGQRDMRVLETRTGKEIFSPRAGAVRIVETAFSPDGTRLAAGCSDGTVKVWDAGTIEGRTLPRLPNQNIPGVISPNGELHATSNGKSVLVREIATGNIVHTLAPATALTHGLAFSPDNRMLACRREDDAVEIWDLLAARPLSASQKHTLPGSGDASTTSGLAARLRFRRVPIWRATFSPDGHLVASTADGETVYIWDSVTGREVCTIRSQQGYANTLAFGPDGRCLATSSVAYAVRIWHSKSGTELGAFEGHTSDVRGLSFSPTGDLIASSSYDGTVKVWDVQGGREILSLTDQADAASDVVFSRDGTRLITASTGKTVKIWEVATGRVLLTLTGHTDPLSTARFSPDSNRLVSLDSSGTIRIWDATPLPEAGFSAR